MKALIWLRIASVLTLVHAALHTIGGVFGQVAPGAATVAVAAMKANAFLAFGSMRTYWEFLRGMGLAVSIFLTLDAIVFWQLGSLTRTSGKRIRPVLASFFVAYLALAVNSNAYFFPGPVITEVLIAACVLMGFMLCAESPAYAEDSAAQRLQPVR